MILPRRLTKSIPPGSFVISNPRELIRAFATLRPIQKVILFPDLIVALADVDWPKLRQELAAIHDHDATEAEIAHSNRTLDMIEHLCSDFREHQSNAPSPSESGEF